MRRLLLLVSVLAVACGDDSDGNGGATRLPSGTVGGRAFAAVEARAIVAGTGTAPCPLPLGGTTVSLGVKALELVVASHANVCDDLGSSQCRFHANAQNVTILLAKLDPSGAEPELAAGTYAVTTSPTTVTPDAGGLLTVAFAQAIGTDASCLGTPSPSVAGGTVRIDRATGPITGRVSLSFADGSTLDGDFSAPLCDGAAPDVCELATQQAVCTLPPLCLP